MPSIDDGYGNARTTAAKVSTTKNISDSNNGDNGISAADRAAAAKRLITKAEGAAAKKASDKIASDKAAKAEAAAKRLITKAEGNGTGLITSAQTDDTLDEIGQLSTSGLGDYNILDDIDDGTVVGTGDGTGTVVGTGDGTGDVDNSKAAALAALRAQLSAAETAAAAAAAAANAAAAEDKAAAEKLAKRTAAIAEALRIQQDNLASGNKLKNRISTTMETDDSVEETGLVSSWMPKWLQESLKGEGNYDPAWVEKNKVAGAKSLESMYDSGQLQRPRSNITDSSGNAIGGMASQDNTAMQRLAAGGSTDPMGDLSAQIVKEDGIDSSWTGAFNQAINGAEGSEYTGGGGLLKFSQDQDKNAIFGDAASPVDGFTESERFGNSNEFATIDANQDGAIDASEATTLSLEKFRDNLGFANAVEAQAFWDSMTPEEQVIFNSKENPSTGTKILETVFGAFMPGYGLLSEFMYNDEMTLKEKLDYSVNTAAAVAERKAKQISNSGTVGSATRGDGNNIPETVDDTVDDTVEVKKPLQSYLDIFNNYKF